MKFTTIFFHLALFLLMASCQAEEELVLQEGEIHGAIHEANIGRATFMGEAIPMEEYAEKDFLTSFGLRDSVDFNIRIFLGKTLTSCIKMAEPGTGSNSSPKHGWNRA